MARNTAKKRWIKAIVLTIGVADCAGLYYAQQKLSTPVPDAIRYDRTAIMVPEEHSMFHAGQPTTFAPVLAEATPAAAPVARLAKAEPDATAPKPAPVFAAAAPVAPPAAKAAPAPAPRAVVTPHLARVEAPAATFHAAPARLTGAKHTASLAAAPAPVTSLKLARAEAPAKAVKAAKPARKAASLASLVPKPRHHSEFTQAFSTFEAPVEATAQLELALPTIEPARVGAAATDFAASTPVLEVPIPAAPVELPPMSASADTPEAKL
jgi:hypothetical protein